jgi:hypothetical protein
LRLSIAEKFLPADYYVQFRPPYATNSWPNFPSREGSKVENQVAAPTGIKCTPTWHRATIAQQKNADGRVATEAAWLNNRRTLEDAVRANRSYARVYSRYPFAREANEEAGVSSRIDEWYRGHIN